MERLPNRYPKISQSHKVPLYKGLSLFYPKLLKISEKHTFQDKNVVSNLKCMLTCYCYDSIREFVDHPTTR